MKLYGRFPAKAQILQLIDARKTEIPFNLHTFPLRSRRLCGKLLLK